MEHTDSRPYKAGKLFRFIMNLIFTGSGFMLMGHFWIGLIYLILYMIAWTVRLWFGLSAVFYPFLILFICVAHLHYLETGKQAFNFTHKWNLRSAVLFLLYFWALPFFFMNVFWSSGHFSVDLLRTAGATLWGLIAGFVVYQRSNKSWSKAIIWSLLVAFSNIIYAFPSLLILLYLIVRYSGKSGKGQKGIKERFVDDDEIEATPELLGNALVLQVGYHFDDLYKLNDTPDIYVDESAASIVCAQLFYFYHSLFAFAPAFNDMNTSEMDRIGSLMLNESFIALDNSDFSDVCKQLIITHEKSTEFFDFFFRFYYHDEIPEKHKEGLQQVMTLCKQKRGDWSDSPLGYLTVKLQYMLCCEVLRMSPEDDFKSFLAVWIYNINTVTTFFSKVLTKIRPVL